MCKAAVRAASGIRRSRSLVRPPCQSPHKRMLCQYCHRSRRFGDSASLSRLLLRKRCCESLSRSARNLSNSPLHHKEVECESKLQRAVASVANLILREPTGLCQKPLILQEVPTAKSGRTKALTATASRPQGPFCNYMNSTRSAKPPAEFVEDWECVSVFSAKAASCRPWN